MKSEPKHNDSNQIIQKEWERMLTEDFDKPEASAFASIDMYIFTYRVSPKKGDLRLNAHKTPCKCTRDKSRVSIGKFRKFPFKWAQMSTSTFWEKMAEKIEVKVAYPPFKK